MRCTRRVELFLQRQITQLLLSPLVVE